MSPRKRAGIRRNYARTAIVAAAVACLATVTVAPAAVAKPILNQHDRGTMTLTQTLCGIEVETTSTFSVRTLGRIAPDGFPRFQTNVMSTQTITNPDTGLSLVTRTRVSVKDLKATDNGDGTVTVLTQQTGLAREVRLSDGTLVVKNVGRVLIERVFSGASTPDDPTDDLVLSERVVSLSGQQSNGEQDIEFFCTEIVEGLT
jgi:hypothetical protein